MFLLRGPHCPRYHWFGWAGGWEARKSVLEARQGEDASTPVDELQILEKMEEGVKQHAKSGDLGTAV